MIQELHASGILWEMIVTTNSEGRCEAYEFAYVRCKLDDTSLRYQ